MDDDVVFFAMVQRYNIYFKYVSLHHDILGSHGAKSSTENIYWAGIYKKIEVDKYSIATKKKNERSDIEIISFVTTDGQKIEIDTESLSKDDIDNLHNILQT